jgi:hypothetical protein
MLAANSVKRRVSGLLCRLAMPDAVLLAYPDRIEPPVKGRFHCGIGSTIRFGASSN